MVWHLLVHVVCQRIICIDIDATVFFTDIKKSLEMKSYMICRSNINAT